jgi:hypothetical protein
MERYKYLSTEALKIWFPISHIVLLQKARNTITYSVGFQPSDTTTETSLDETCGVACFHFRENSLSVNTSKALT